MSEAMRACSIVDPCEHGKAIGEEFCIRCEILSRFYAATWWMSRESFRYLFAPRAYDDMPWLRVVWCRFKGHPHGVVYYNPGGYEPDMSCKGCGDDLG